MVRRRRSESGQALLFALLALLLTSVAAALVAEDLSLRERALQEEAARMHVRALLDGALADALARLAAHDAPREREPWGGGATTCESVSFPPNNVRLRVTATYDGRQGAAVALVVIGVDGPRVVSWARAEPSG